MNTETTALNLRPLTDDIIERMMQMRFGIQGAARDNEGRMREITVEEDAFAVTLRDEAKRRGLR